MSNVFDEWEDVVDCNDCTHYWDDSCDGASKATKRHCTTFIAKRGVVIPQQIKELQKSIKTLSRTTLLLSMALIIHIIGGWFSG